MRIYEAVSLGLYFLVSFWDVSEMMKRDWTSVEEHQTKNAKNIPVFSKWKWFCFQAVDSSMVLES